MDDSGFGDGLLDGMPIWFALIFGLVFVLIVSVFVAIIVTGLVHYVRNSRSPLLTSPATVLTKRQETSGSSDGPVSTRYYVTFSLPGGERVELPVSGRESGTIVEGDQGQLSWQGTWFKGFIRAGRTA